MWNKQKIELDPILYLYFIFMMDKSFGGSV